VGAALSQLCVVRRSVLLGAADTGLLHWLCWDGVRVGLLPCAGVGLSESRGMLFAAACLVVMLGRAPGGHEAVGKGWWAGHTGMLVGCILQALGRATAA
jgi:hypothetical protein